MAIDGLLLVDKATGCTSHDVVQKVRRLLRQKRIGHCGTLDPDATGLLLLPIGQATRLTRFLIHAPKVYEGVVRFGVATDTYDASGRVTAERPTAGLDLDRIDAEMARFEGTFDQQLPAYSARKVGGVKLYELARRGEEVPVETKEVTVSEFRRLGDLVDDRLPFRLACSSGTYARSLAHDLGARLGCGAHLAELRRVAIGPFGIAEALDLETLASRLESGDDLGPALLPLAGIPLPLVDARLDAQQERRIRNGQTALIPGLECDEGDWVRMLGRGGRLIAVGSVTERMGSAGLSVVQPRIVFSPGPDVVEFSRT